jgi:dipeptidyl aminopeptidase/acylaminoacyl peptidase
MTASALLRRLTACLIPSSILCACLLAPAPAPAQTGVQSQSRIGALLDDLGKTKHIGPVALSPDGKTVAVVLGYTLTLQPVGRLGVPQRPAICPKSEDPQITSLTWSPDSAHLALLTTCGESLGVYLIDSPEKASGKAPARRLAELHGFAEALQYAPDGKHLALLYVEGATRPSGALAAMKPPSGVIGVEGLEIQRVASIDASTGALAQVTPPGLHVYEFAWTPDSSKLAYIAAPPPGENNWWVAKLYTQPLAPSAAPTAILDPATVSGPLHGLQIAVPRWSPDGSKIAFIGGLMSDQGATGGDLYLVPADGSGGPLDVTPDSATTVEWIDWLPDGRIAITKITDGSDRIDLFTLHPNLPAAPAGASIAAEHSYDHTTLYEHLPYSIGDGRLAGSFSLSKDGVIAAWSASSYSNAPEVYAGPLDGSALPQITHINDALKPSWGKTESIRWTNDGYDVQGWLFYPANYDPSKKYPMIVMVHGGPSSAVIPRWPYAGFGAAPFSAMGYFVLEPNPRGSYGEGEAFTQANRKDFGYGDLRDILAGVDAVEKKLPVDDHRIGITGWSYGGFMTMFAVTQTQRFHAAVAGAGISDWLSYYGENSIDQWMTPFFGASVYDDPAVYAKSSAIDFIKQAHTPTLVVVGDRDGECPAPQSFEFWHALKAEGVPTQLVVYPNEGHGFSDPAHRRDVIERAVGWFDSHMQ